MTKENKKFAELDKVHQLLKAVYCEDLLAPMTVGQQQLSTELLFVLVQVDNYGQYLLSYGHRCQQVLAINCF